MNIDLTQFDETTRAVLEQAEVKAAIAAAHEAAVEVATQSLKKNRDEILAEKGALESKVAGLEKLGDIDELKKLKDATKKKDTDLNAKDTEVADLRKQLEAMRAQAHNEKIAAEVGRALADAKGNVHLLEPHLKSRVKFVEEDGTFKMVTLDKYGQPSDKSVADLVAEFKGDATFGAAFAAVQPSGGGAKPNGTSLTSNNPFAKGASYNVTEQMKVMTQDRAQARKLAIEAGVQVEGLTD